MLAGMRAYAVVRIFASETALSPLSPRHLKLGAGVGFVAIGVWILVRA